MIEEAAGFLVQCGNRLLIFRIKFKIEDVQIFSMRSLRTDLGIATTPRCVNQRRTTWATLLPCLAAIECRASFWNMLFLPSANGPQASICTLFSEAASGRRSADAKDGFRSG